MGFIYKITNIKNEKIYIGLTFFTIEQRWKTHLKDSKYVDNKFYRALKKYGAENFVV